MTKDQVRSTEEALKLALEALGEIEWSNNSQWQSDRAKAAIPAIKQALAAPYVASPRVQEPVNQRAYEMALRQWDSWKQYALKIQERLVKYEGGAPMVLNTTPPAAQRQPARSAWVHATEWRGLTDEEVKHMLELFVIPPHHVEMVVRAIEDKLKEKNSD